MYARQDQPQPVSLPQSTSYHSDPHSIQNVPPTNGHTYTSHTAEGNGFGNTTADMQYQQYQAQMQDPAVQARRMGTVNEPLSVRAHGRQYSLSVEQQPIRARMCGFGDKDRRPITPPPCIRLIIIDTNTGQEIEPSDIDSTYFVLTVDLWNQEGNSEVNLVRHSNHTPSVSISTTSTTSYPPPPDRHLVRMDVPVQAPYGNTQGMAHQMPGYGMPQTTGYGAPPPMLPPAPNPADPHQYGAPPPQLPAAANPYGQPPPPPMHSGAMMPPMMSQGPPPQAPPGYMVALNQVATHAPASGMFTRNLIGSLSVNAFKLLDTQQKTGFWFVLQDLSVRTEGYFRYISNPYILPFLAIPC